MIFPARTGGLIAGLFLADSALVAQYVGSQACRPCHAARVERQATTGHARALAKASAGSPGQWAFGAGEKATTWVSQVDRDTYAEHGLSYFAATRSTGLTPGHETSADIRYRTFDPEATTLRCFRCHSTGPLSLGANYAIEPSEPGVHCESCHGPGGEHVNARGRAGTILNPKRLNAVELNDFCGVCHRKAPESDWTDKWKTRHQPSYLVQSACFRKSGGALTCLTCHDPHGPLNTSAAQYDARCKDCHKAVQHRKTLIARSTCIECHMPQVRVSSQLSFTNHWIGIYAEGRDNLVPARTVAKSVRPPVRGDPRLVAPADPASLRPLFEHALNDREKESGPNDPKVARSASDLGLFLVSIGDAEAAEALLRRALEIDQRHNSAEVGEDAEQLGRLVAGKGRNDEAVELFRQAAAGSDRRASGRSLANLAIMDPEHADEYYRSALAAERQVEGHDSKRSAILLNNLAATLQEKKDYPSALKLFREALAIQEKILGKDSPAAASTLSNLGSLLETMGQHAEAERTERMAVRIFEEKLGPWSAELATSCTNLADILWTKGDRITAGNLYRRSISIDESVYGPDSPEVAGDLTNYGTLLKESGPGSEADRVLNRALRIYEKSGGSTSPQAVQVRQLLGK